MDSAVLEPWTVRFLPLLSVHVSLMISAVWARRTVGDALGVEVGLDVAAIDTDPFEIDFVFDVRHEDEGGDNTLALGCRQLGADLSVPYIVGGGEEGSDGAFGHGQEGRFLAAAGVGVDGRHALGLPVDLGGIAEVLVDGLHVIKRAEGIGA